MDKSVFLSDVSTLASHAKDFINEVNGFKAKYDSLSKDIERFYKEDKDFANILNKAQEAFDELQNLYF